MVFGAWHPLDGAAAAAPSSPGVLQSRGTTLLAHPRGKSAMILYAASGDAQPLSAWLAGPGAAVVARAGALGACYVRFAETAAPQAALARLLSTFEERFGALPPGNRPTVTPPPDPTQP